MQEILTKQIGGNHYKDMAFQPLDLINKLRCSFTQGCIIKYICRYKNKNGKQDIEKCIHYARIAMDLGGTWPCDKPGLIMQFCTENRLSRHQSAIIRHVVNTRWNSLIDECQQIIAEEY